MVIGCDERRMVIKWLNLLETRAESTNISSFS